MTPTIRPATPDDADFIAWTVLSAQRGNRPRGWFDFALDRPEAECLDFVRRIAVEQGKSFWHHSCFWIAEVEGASAAALCALPVAGTLASARGAIEETARDIGWDDDAIAAPWQRGAYVRQCWTGGEDGDWMVEHVACRPEYRKRGLTSALIEHVFVAGRAAGFDQAAITFYIGNDAAERCYAKAGFTFADERRNPAFEALTGAPGFRRFGRAI